MPYQGNYNRNKNSESVRCEPMITKATAKISVKQRLLIELNFLITFKKIFCALLTTNLIAIIFTHQSKVQTLDVFVCWESDALCPPLPPAWLDDLSPLMLTFVTLVGFSVIDIRLRDRSKWAKTFCESFRCNGGG